MGSTPGVTSPNLGAVLGYRGEDVELFLMRSQVERSEACDRLAAARAGLEQLRDELAASTELRDRLGDLVLEAQRAAWARRAEVDRAVAEIAAQAEATAGQIVDEARAEAAARFADHPSAADPCGVIDLSARRGNDGSA